MAYFRSRYHVAIVVWWTAFLAIAGLAVLLNAHETLDAFFLQYDAYQLDELFVALNVGGALGLVYSLLRVRDLLEEVDRRSEAEAKVDRAKLHDCLTGLPNRQMLNLHLAGPSGGQANNEACVAYSIDLTGLKKVNDELGQSLGDAVIQTTASRLSQLEPSDLVFHLGGDRFIVLSKNIAAPDLHSDKIMQAIGQPIVEYGASIEIAANLGYAAYPCDIDNRPGLSRAAECAMYVAKKDGPNVTAAFTSAMAALTRKREKMEASLKAAINADAILPYFQPLVDLKTGAIVGYEALARWKTPSGSFVPPSEFIPLAEELGLITRLTSSLLLRACRDAASWPAETTLAFNISAAQLNDRQLGLRILKILDETGFPVHRLELEVTESAIIQDAESAHFVLDSLVRSGIRIALDDFGTGYSSLSQLAQYPFDKIKIDRSFISSSEHSEKQNQILQGIVSLGSRLGMTIVAEGIERESEMRKLTELGCDIGQGYFLGRPAANITGPPGSHMMQA